MIFTVTLNPSIDRTLYFNNLKLGEVNRAQKVQTNLGGKGVNVSQALHNLGVPSVTMGLAGGTAGELFIQGLTERGLECDFTRMSGEMRSNITAIDLVTRQTTKLNEPGPQVSAAELDSFEQQLAMRLKSGDMVILSGSLPPGAPVDTYARLIHLAKSRGTLCALDSSGDALVAGCRAQPEWIKPNVEEAAYLTGLDMNRISWQEALLQIKTFGVQYVLLTAGERGVILADAVHAWHALPPKVAATSTVGAGDAALASAICAWRNGSNLQEIARRSAAAGTAAALLEGSTMPTDEQIQAVYADTSTNLLY